MFREARTGPDDDAPMRLAHTLKGVAASMGAVDVAAAAEALEKACKDHAASETIEALLSQMLAELEPVFKGIGALPQDQASTSDSTGTGAGAANSRAALTKLRQALEEFDVDATDIAAELLLNAQGTPAYPAIESIVDCLHSFDFSGALDILRDKEAAILAIKDED
jgi:HPt (histidine-containing phosphotransfer) domain-containing protein